MARSGRLSLARRDAVLSDIYGECAESPAAAPLALDTFDLPSEAVVHRTDSRSLIRQRMACKQQFDLGSQLDLVFEP